MPPALTWRALSVAERPAPPRELQVPQADVTARSLCLRWVPGGDGASPIRYFTLQLPWKLEMWPRYRVWVRCHQ